MPIDFANTRQNLQMQAGFAGAQNISSQRLQGMVAAVSGAAVSLIDSVKELWDVINGHALQIRNLKEQVGTLEARLNEIAPTPSEAPLVGDNDHGNMKPTTTRSKPGKN